MDGNVSRNPLDRFFSLFMEKMIGPDFEEGLGNLKKKSRASDPAGRAAGGEILNGGQASRHWLRGNRVPVP